MTASSTQNPNGVPYRSRNLTGQQLQRLKDLSPAVLRYLDILKKTPGTIEETLRYERVERWCDHVLEILFGGNNPELICRSWSETAEKIILKAWQAAELDSEPIALVAMGKLGARELNLSSDIDLIAIQTGAASEAATSKLRRFTQILQLNTDFGFCFRVDFELRPGGGASALLPSFAEVEDHYWQRGETWERLALVRARILLGPADLVRDLQNLFQKFSYRKFIDYSLLKDLEQLRSKIFFHRETVRDGAINLKLVEGGIRDIELFVNSLQVVHGGRIKDLQVRGIRHAIEILKSRQLFDANELDVLGETYWMLRDLENRTQAFEDQQTHVMDKSAALSINKDLDFHLQRSFTTVNKILGFVDKHEGLPTGEAEQKLFLQKYNFTSEKDWQTWTELLGLTARSSRLQHDEGARQKALVQFISEISKGLDPSLGLQYLCDFFKSTRAKSSFFSLLLHSPKLIGDLSRLFSSSPYLAQIFVARPELLDSFIMNVAETAELGPQVSWDQFLDNLVETKLMALIKYSIELLSGKDLRYFHSGLSDLADRTFDHLLERLRADHPQSSLIPLRLGRWGAQEMGIRSDLDFILIAEKDQHADDLKISRRLISRLTEHHKGGSLYFVDLRLRPTGSAGPLILKFSELIDHLNNQAAPWERQSYLRSRMNPQADEQIRKTILDRGLSADDLTELTALRRRLRTEAKDPSALKYARGGLVDTEYAAQVACILNGVNCGPNTFAMLEALGKIDTRWKEMRTRISQRYEELRHFEQLQKLLGDNGDFEQLGRLLRQPKDDLAQKIDQLLLQNYRELKELDPVLAAE